MTGLSTTDHALVRYVEETAEERRARTPFQAFLEALLERQSADTLRSMHSATWTSLPMERLLADGSWVLLSAVAGKYHWPLETTNDVAKVAERVDRLVAVGLLHQHETALGAAVAFENKVIGALELAMTLGYRPGLTLSNDAWRALMCGQTDRARQELIVVKAPVVGAKSAFWAAPCYLFLADCFKAARELGENLAGRIERFARANLIPTGRLTNLVALQDMRASYVSEDPDVAEAVIFLDINRDYDLRGTDLEFRSQVIGDKDRTFSLYQCHRVFEALDIMADMELRLSTLRAVPIDFAGVPNQVLIDSKGVEESWISSRLLCAAMNVKAENLLPRLYGPAIRAIAKLTDEEIFDRAVAQMLERGTRWQPEQEACFRRMLAQRLPWLRQARSELSMEGGQEAMVEVAPEEMELDASGALDVALEKYPAINGQMVGWTKQRVSSYLKKRVLPIIPWSALSADEVIAMFSVDVIPVDLLLPMVTKMKAKARRAVVDHLKVHQGDLTPQLIELGLAKVDLDLFNATGPDIPKKQLANFLQEELHRLSRKYGVAFETEVISPWQLVRSFVALPDKERQRLWREPSVRPALVWLTDMIVVEDPRDQPGLSAYDLAQFPVKIGIELWRDYYAGVLVCRRELEYAQAVDREHFCPPWSELSDPEHPDYEEHSKAFYLRRTETLSEIMATHSEERAFRFLYEGDLIVEARWAKYQQAQAKYHRAHGR